MRNKLLSQLHGIYDKDPHAVLAMRLRHPLTLQWKIVNRQLMLSTRQGMALPTISLSGKWLYELAVELAEIGCTVEYINDTLKNRTADSLLEGEGREDISNGDHLYCYDSLLWSILDAFAVALGEVSNDIASALKQVYFHSAEGFWLDVWGSFFNLYRQENETDTVYLLRIITETCRNRCNATAIRMTIKELTGIDVYIHEMWEEIFTLDYSTLSGSHALCDGIYYTWGVIEPIVYQPLTDEQRTQIKQIIERNRMCGCIATDPAESTAFIVQRDIDYSSIFHQEYKSITWTDGRNWTGKWTDRRLYGMSISMSIRALMNEVETGLFILQQDCDISMYTSQGYRPVDWQIGHSWIGQWTEKKQVGMKISMGLS